MQITFALPHVFYPGSNPVENARTLRILLDALISIDETFLKHHTVPGLYQSGVVYGRTQIWDSIPALYSRGFGDCKSLTAALVAQYRAQGKTAQPVFRWAKRSDGSGATDYHILVQTADGFEDPSKVLGMGANENAYFPGHERRRMVK